MTTIRYSIFSLLTTTSRTLILSNAPHKLEINDIRIPSKNIYSRNIGQNCTSWPWGKARQVPSCIELRVTPRWSSNEEVSRLQDRQSAKSRHRRCSICRSAKQRLIPREVLPPLKSKFGQISDARDRTLDEKTTRT